jgi:Ser/Thr protein kinase RdoA (MazF antagonist)
MTASYLLLENTDIQVIADRYGLGRVIEQHSREKIYHLHTTQGEFALRFSHANASAAHLEATQAIRTTLTSAGLPVGAPARAVDGSTVFRWAGLLGELQPWIAHNDDGHNWNHVIMASAALGHIHTHMAGSRAAPDQREDPWRSPAELAAHLAAHTEILRTDAEKEGIAIGHHLDLAGYVLNRLCEYGTLDTCERQLTHGDFQGRNLLFQDDTLVGIIDFERLERRPRLYDLAWPFVFWRFFGTKLGSYGKADWQAARACCEAYSAAATGLTERDWATLPLLMAYISARGIAYSTHEDEPAAEILAFAKALPFAVWLVDHPNDALALLRG